MNVRDEHVLYGLRRHRFDLSNKIVIKLFAKVFTVDHNHARVRNANSRISTGPRNHVDARFDLFDHLRLLCWRSAAPALSLSTTRITAAAATVSRRLSLSPLSLWSLG